MEEEGCALDVLTSLLDEDMSGDECSEPVNESRTLSEPEEATKKSDVLENNNTHPPECGGSDGGPTSPKDDILAEMKRMRERMEELERQLQQKSNNVPVSSTTKSSSPKQQQSRTTTIVDKDNIDLFSSESEGNAFADTKIISESSSSKSSPSFSQKSQQNKMTVKKKSDLKTDLFGESDNSDWEDMDGEKTKLSEAGDELKKLLKKKNDQRVAHTPTHDVAQLRTKAQAKQGSVMGSLSSMLTSPTSSNNNSTFNNNNNNNASTFYNSSSTKSSPPSSQKKITTTSDYVDASTDPFSGIRVTKPLVSSTSMSLRMQGRKMFKLSSLHSKSKNDLDCDWVTIGVLVHKPEPKKSSSGKTYCIWKLNDLQNCDQTLSFFLFGEVYKTHWKVGVGTVVGILNPSMMDKSEKYQSDVAFTINNPQKLMIMGTSTDLGMCKSKKKNGSPCTNVVNKMQGDFCTYHVNAAYKKTCVKRSELNSYTGVTPKSYEKKVLPKGGMFFYQGKSYTSLPIGTQAKDQVTVKKLQQQQTRLGKEKLSTMHLQQISASDQAKLDKLTDTKQQAFLDLLSAPSVGSMNLVKHLVKQEQYQTDEGGSNTVMIQSVTPKELLKIHKRKMELKRKLSAVTAPVLGRGLESGCSINLDASSRPSSKMVLSSNEAKRVAILKVQSKGGIEKSNPNAVRKESGNEKKTREKIKKRVASDLEELKNESESTTASSASSSSSSRSLPPPAKRSKLLGNVDLNSPEVKKLMKMKSSHVGAIAELENEKQEMYFSTLEKKEQYEDKMRSITEMKCTLFTCKVCSYTALSVGERCKKENHPTKKHQGTKRFFQCRGCKTRCVAFTKIPTDPCGQCGGYNFEKTSMMRDKSGPKLENEVLSIRGDETKFLNSLSYKVTSAVDL